MTSVADNSMTHLPSQSDEKSLCDALEEYQRRSERGEAPSIEQFVEEFSQHASELQACLEGLQQVRSLALSLSATGSSDSSPHKDQSDGLLGDYRILREVGRGGMGIVYEAQQISLSRRVALKILPFAAVLDPRHLQRFKNEALAAAHLDHPHVVEVYGIGCERGIHFYAMRFIDGVTLAEVIAERRSLEPGVRSPEGSERAAASDSALITPHSSLPPDTVPVVRAALSTVNSLSPKERFRRVAGLGVQAAEAIEHAHQTGIVHRDIKPSNLMLDERGKLWITDFGLARRIADASMTMTGDLVGTLRYMSPEQAESRNAILDHRTDIYSLGATLYELATDRPVVQGQERAAILREIAETDPTPPRKHAPSMPADLETILLKCLAKEPSARYSTAKALAEDLRRFLEQKPVLAKRATLAKKLQKLARRHPFSVRVGIVLLAGAVAAGAIAYAQRLSLHRQVTEQVGLSLAAAQSALDAGDFVRATQHISEAQGRMSDYRESLESTAESVDRLAVAIQSQRADQERFVTFLALARDGQERMSYGSHLDGHLPARKALALYEVDTNPNWPARLKSTKLTAEQKQQVRETAYDTLLLLADNLVRWQWPIQIPEDSRRSLDLLESARKHHSPTRAFWFVRERAHRLLKNEHEAAEDHRLFLATQATSAWDHFLPGHTAGWEGDVPEAMRSYQAALRIQPNHFSSLFYLGMRLLECDRRSEAIGYFSACIALRPDHFFAYSNRAEAYLYSGQHQQAELDWATAIRVAPDDEHRLTAYWWRRPLLLAMGRTEEADQELDKVIALAEDILKKSRSALPQDGRRFCVTAERLASAYLIRHRYYEAEPILRAGLAIVGGYPIPGGTEHFQTLLGAALVGQARGLKKADPGAAKRLLDEAEPLLLESYLELRSDTDASGDFKQGWVPESLQRLIDFYHEADRSDEAAKWQAEFDLSNSQPANHN